MPKQTQSTNLKYEGEVYQMSFILTNTPRDFIPESQKNEENPLTFICIPPTRKMILDTQEKLLQSISLDEISEDSVANAIPISEMMSLALDTCVVGWKNMVDTDGNDILFSKEAFATFNDQTILMELYSYVKELAEGNLKV